VDAYPGGIVDRVALLGNGEYNVHMIGVNWPHHVFVSSTFKVVGGEQAPLVLVRLRPMNA
jgi:hypothetical protein